MSGVPVPYEFKAVAAVVPSWAIDRYHLTATGIVSARPSHSTPFCHHHPHHSHNLHHPHRSVTSKPGDLETGERFPLRPRRDHHQLTASSLHCVSGSRGQTSLYDLWVRSCPALFQTTQSPMTNDL